MFGNDHFLWMLESYLEENHKDIAGHQEIEVQPDASMATRLIEESKVNTVSDVVAEDMPPLFDSDNNEEFKELIKTIRTASVSSEAN